MGYLGVHPSKLVLGKKLTRRERKAPTNVVTTAHTVFQLGTDPPD